MKRVNKSVKLRLYPTKEQEVLLAKHFGCARFVYNYFLNLEKDTYQQTKKFNFYNKNAATLVRLKKDVQYEFLKEVNSQSLQWALKNLNQAFLNCFKHGHCKFPVFKSKYAKQSFKVPVNSSFKLDSRIHLPKFLSGIKFRQKTKFIDPKFNSVTISKTTSGQYFAAVQYEDDVRALPTNSNITASRMVSSSSAFKLS